MSVVHFASSKVKSLSADLSLPAKFKRLLQKYPMKEMFDGKTVAIKMHVGGHLGYTTIHPLFVRILVDAVREAGG
ncbi:MAG: 4Fe-4S ferredoxin, partial [Armatimonadota bacterium]|nr:4Fe-4S ferredoxin [Armatimonadota bacterium]